MNQSQTINNLLVNETPRSNYNNEHIKISNQTKTKELILNLIDFYKCTCILTNGQLNDHETSCPYKRQDLKNKLKANVKVVKKKL